ncbi:MAG: nicotinate-nucleotide adenylyltransferase [Chloroflexi bacterium]|nr:nicotinate-nucleotide adenylyltransferase [Chloroflexota bacterium]
MLDESVTRLGVFGGTFDPIHYGHLVIAEEVRVRLSLSEVLFAPAGQPPHKRGRPRSPAEDRLMMTRLATSSNPYFSVSRLDIDRPGPSYTVDLLELIKAERNAATELFFILGVDELAGLLAWKEPRRLLRLAHLVAVPRPGYSFDPRQLEPALPNIMERVQFVATPELAIAAADLRRRIAVGLPIKYQLPESVEEYIYLKGLYRPTSRKDVEPEISRGGRA